MEEVKNILRILEETKVALKEKDALKLKQLSDQTNNTASLVQDADNIAVAVIVYSLGKILERGYTENFNLIVKKIDDVIRCVKKEGNLLQNSLKQLRTEIGKISPGMKKHIQDVFRKASINKASKIYGHGVSMENTAKLLGITVWELADYAGQTDISNVPESKTLSVKERIKIATSIFEGDEQGSSAVRRSVVKRENFG